MSCIPKSKFHHPQLAVNELGLTYRDYEGSMSTLCAGCGHDSVSAAVVQACFELSLPAHRIAKLSGIGCSSKAPTYFLGKSHGFNSVHGRMPSVATGANLANRDLIYLGMSGDGDSASIGLGQFAHVVRRKLNMSYIVANNGAYGLTKGQPSATADLGSVMKGGKEVTDEGIDLASLALSMGATYVARSFSGDKEQLVPLIKGALSHQGFAFIDVMSPCVTFNNHQGSTKSYDHLRDHMESLISADFIPHKSEITVQTEPGVSRDIFMHDGSLMRLRATDDSYDPTNRNSAMSAIRQHDDKGEILTGLLYLEPGNSHLHENLNTICDPLSELGYKELCPGSDVLESLNNSFR
ncbi:MAG: 2-oxoacid:ferredoxin oxidoreductase subunit beta [Cycloclasticus sp.]